MKKLMISAALLTVLGANVWANPGDEVKGAVKASVTTATKNGVYNLVYKGTGTVKVTITNAAGEIVMTDQINAEGGFLRPYNFTTQPAGTYTLTVLDRNGKASLPLVHGGAAGQFRPNVQIKPVQDKKFELTLIGSSAQAVAVNIYDDASNLVYTDQIAQQGSFSRVYDLTKIQTGVFTFEVVSQGNVITKKQF
jgi:flagellar hook assembly protein FlgD